MPASTTPDTLWRGAWEVPGTRQILQSKPKGLAQSRFQSSTLVKAHACNFLSARNEPATCRSSGGASGCLSVGHYFPVLYEIQTVHAKDVRKWNEKEQEFILVPEVPFDVISVEKIPNDKYFMMNTKDLALWLRKSDSFTDLAGAVELKLSASLRALELSPIISAPVEDNTSVKVSATIKSVRSSV